MYYLLFSSFPCWTGGCLIKNLLNWKQSEAQEWSILSKNFVHLAKKIRILHKTLELQSVTFGPHVEGEVCRNKKTQKISSWVEVIWTQRQWEENVLFGAIELSASSSTNPCYLHGLVLRWRHPTSAQTQFYLNHLKFYMKPKVLRL